MNPTLARFQDGTAGAPVRTSGVRGPRRVRRVPVHRLLQRSPRVSGPGHGSLVAVQVVFTVVGGHPPGSTVAERVPAAEAPGPKVPLIEPEPPMPMKLKFTVKLLFVIGDGGIGVRRTSAIPAQRPAKYWMAV